MSSKFHKIVVKELTALNIDAIIILYARHLNEKHPKNLSFCMLHKSGIFPSSIIHTHNVSVCLTGYKMLADG